MTLTYLVNGAPATTVDCPAVGTPLTVTVQAHMTTKPSCAYSAVKTFDLLSEPLFLQGGLVVLVIARSLCLTWTH